jgi:general secretion pathway protein G
MRKSKNRAAGFTLIELLVVLVILALLGSIVGPRVMGKLGKAKTDTARTQVEQLRTGLDLFRLEVGRYPSTEEGLLALIEAPAGAANWNGPYLNKNKVPTDPWDHEYHYASPGEHAEYDLYSLGADAAAGGEGENQDVVSWE